jgi:hypothetical protein
MARARPTETGAEDVGMIGGASTIRVYFIKATRIAVLDVNGEVLKNQYFDR